MHKLVCCGLQIYCIIISLIVICNAGTLNQPKRVGSNQKGLFPFPRVGRGGETSWDFGLGKSNEGKINLFAFPRVGRSETGNGDIPVDRMMDHKKMNPHVWFGPRLGKVQKRDIIVYDIPHDYPRAFLFPSGSQEARKHYTPRMSSESEEDLEDGEE